MRQKYDARSINKLSRARDALAIVYRSKARHMRAVLGQNQQNPLFRANIPTYLDLRLDLRPRARLEGNIGIPYSK
jgi:hypothetical protein